MRRNGGLAVLLAAALAAAPVGLGTNVAFARGGASGYVPEGYNLVWSDEFEGSELNRNDWNVELHQPGWVNSELQAYVDSADNIRVEDGKLKLIPVETVEQLDGTQDLLANRSFSDESWETTIANWGGEYVTEATDTLANNAHTFAITNPGTEDWHVQLKNKGLSLKNGVTYHVSFDAQSDVDRTIRTGVQNDTNYNWYGGINDVALSAGQKQTVTFDFTMNNNDDGCALYVSMGKVANDTPAASTITLSNFSITYEASGDGIKSYTSGRVNTQNKKTFTYGYFECRAKVPVGQGYLPAFWLMSNDENIYGQWPRCGEIDCMEVMGQEPNKIYGTIHFGNPHSESQGTKILDEGSFADSYHTFGCEWLPGKITWYVDGVKFHEESRWYSTTEGLGTLTYPAPFDSPFYVILNLAIGGSWVGNPDANTTYGESNAYLVDYVRIYQLDEYDENVTMPEKPFNPIDPDADGNYVRNASFAVNESLTDDINWKFATANGGDATATIADNKVTVSTTSAGTSDYSVQLMQAGIPFEKGATYQVSFKARANEARTMNVDIKAPDHGYKQYMTTFKPALTDEMQTFTTDVFKMTSDSDENGRLEFNMGAMGSTADVQITDVSVKKIAEPDPNEKEVKTVLSNGNYVYNGSFQEGEAHLGYWSLGDTTSAHVSNLADGRRLQVSAPVTLTQDELAFTAGTAYALSFDAQAENAGDTVEVNVGGKKFTATLTDENETYSFKIPASVTFSNQDFTVTFAGTGTIWFDNVMLCEDSIIKNGSFSNGLTGFEPYVADDANASYVVDSLNEDSALDVTVNNTGDQDWKVQFKQSNINLVQGQNYRLSFKAKSSVDRPIRVVLQGLEPLGWPIYSHDNVFDLTSEYQTFTDEFTMEQASDPAAFLSICLGKVGDFASTEQHRVVIDDLSLEVVGAESTVVTDPIAITKSDITVEAEGLIYIGEELTPEVTVVVDGKTLELGTDYTIAYANNINAGKGVVVVSGKGQYKGNHAVTFAIAKAQNTLTASGKTVEAKASTLAKKDLTVKKNSAFSVKGAKGSVSFKKLSGNAGISVSQSGSITIAKGLNKGTYAVEVRVTAAGNDNYKKGSEVVTVTVHVA